MRTGRIGGQRIAALILSSPVAGYFLATAGFAILNYSDYGAATPQFLRYIAVPMLLASLLILSAVFLKPRLAVRVGSYALAVLAAFFTVESILTYRMLKVRLAMLGQISESERAAMNEKVVRGFTLKRINTLAGTERLSSAVLSAIPGSEVLLCTKGGAVVDYSADRFGFANENSVYTRTIDVLVVGDSFVEGLCLDPPQSMVSQMRRAGLNAVGMGMRGNGPLLELATIGRYGPALKPPLVVMAFFEGNDWENLARSLDYPWLAETLRDGADFGSPQVPDTSLSRVRQAMRQVSDSEVSVADVIAGTALVRNFFALQLTGTALGLIYPKVHGEIPQYRDVLLRARQVTQSWGGQFVLLYIPQTDRFLGVLPTDFVFDQLRTRVLKAAEEAGVEVLDLVPVFHGEPNPARFYAADGHFSAEGSRFIAGWLADRLKLTRKRLDRLTGVAGHGDPLDRP